MPGFLARDLVQPLDLSLIPNLVNLGAEWQDPAYDPGNAHSMPYMWWTTGFAYDTEKIAEDLTSWAALWDARWKGKMAMLDDYRETFAAALIRLGYSVNTTSDAELDEALALLQEQKPLLRKYTADDIGDLASGDVWLSHAWGADVYQVSTETAVGEVRASRPRAAVRGSDAMVLLANAPHPIAAHLFINHMLDAQVSAANTNYICYMGPNEAAKEFIDPAILEDPTLNPDKAAIDKLQELLDLGAGPAEVPGALDEAPRRSLSRSERRGRTSDGPGPDARRGLPPAGHGLAGRLLRGPARDHLRRQPRRPRPVRRRDPRHARACTTTCAPSSRTSCPTVANSLRYATLTTIFSIVDRLPDRLLDQPLRRPPQGAPAGPRHAPVLDQLGDPDLRLDDDPARQRRRERDPRAASGIIDEPIALLNTDLAVVLGMTYGFLPFAILPLYVSIDRLDPSLVAAARDLYAGGRAAFWHVTLPLTMPGVIAAALLTFIPAIGDFVTPDLLGGAQTITIAKVIQTLFLSSRDWPFGAALGFLLIVATIVGTVATLRILRREVIG